ncbi:hypothetical protein HNQ56_003552 [Anaerotaenia torta]|uniref:hypothetical protein n=1 Tax=Anaerotaenia torta TaxID=433293 RepID=UPI003D247607
MRPERLIYTFVSYASNYNTSWGKGTALEGIERTATLAHKYNIPVTWIVNGGSVPMIKDWILSWHETYGDDVILQCPMYGQDPRNRKAELKALLEQEWNIVQEAFPWAKTRVAARGQISQEIIQALEELDFQGLWGYCWEQTWWDGISHKGIPWGFWYVDSNRYKIPHQGKGKIVGCEWTVRDFNRTYHSGCPCIYSTDPNDVLRAGLCTGDNIEYWKDLFQDYLNNTDHNNHVFFLQQQEAHEMEYSDRFAVFPEEHVKECASMLDHFFRYIKTFPITFTTLPAAIRMYHEENSVTAKSCILTSGSRHQPETNEYTLTLGGTAAGPWPETFLYYDSRCQMAFVKGECTPRTLRSYAGKCSMDEEFLETIPQVFTVSYEKTEKNIDITYEIGYHPPIPFGLVYWDDLRGYKAASCEGACHVEIIKDKLAFIRMDLDGEKRKVHLKLEQS